MSNRIAKYLRGPNCQCDACTNCEVRPEIQEAYLAGRQDASLILHRQYGIWIRSQVAVAYRHGKTVGWIWGFVIGTLAMLVAIQIGK
jgi:hypothetical protein